VLGHHDKCVEKLGVHGNRFKIGVLWAISF
jgi:hypothetical protein